VDFLFRVFSVPSSDVDAALVDTSHPWRRRRDVDDWLTMTTQLCGTDAARLRRQALAATGDDGDSNSGDDDDSDVDDDDVDGAEGEGDGRRRDKTRSGDKKAKKAKDGLLHMASALAVRWRMDQVISHCHADAVCVDDDELDEQLVATVETGARSRGGRSRCFFRLPEMRVDACRGVSNASVTRAIQRFAGEEGLRQQQEMLRCFLAGECNRDRLTSSGNVHAAGWLTREGLRKLLGRAAVSKRVAVARAAAGDGDDTAGDETVSGARRRGGIAEMRELYAAPSTVDPADSACIQDLPLGWRELHRVCAEARTDGVRVLYTLVLRKVVMVEWTWKQELEGGRGAWQAPIQNKVDGVTGAVVGVRAVPRRNGWSTFGSSPVTLLGVGCDEKGMEDQRAPGLRHPNAVARCASAASGTDIRDGGAGHIIAAVDPGAGWTIATVHTGVQARNTISGGRHGVARGGVYSVRNGDSLTGVRVAGATKRKASQREVTVTDTVDDHPSHRRRRHAWIPAPQAAAAAIRAQFAGEAFVVRRVVGLTAVDCSLCWCLSRC
jgi:hypothetical protein